MRLLNGVGKPAESVFPWGMEYEPPHAVTVKAMGDVRLPYGVDLWKRFSEGNVVHRYSAVMLVQGKLPARFLKVDVGVVRRDESYPRLANEAVDSEHGVSLSSGVKCR